MSIKPLLGSRQDPGSRARTAFERAIDKVGGFADVRGTDATHFAAIGELAVEACRRQGREGPGPVDRQLDAWATAYVAAKQKRSPEWWREFVGLLLSEDGAVGAPAIAEDGTELDDSGNPVFREIDGESDADRRRRLREHNRRIAEDLG